LKQRLLIAEDDPINRKILGQVFKLQNYDPEFAANGLEAVEMWEKGGYALIIMDVQMPRMDGFAATRAIRERELARGRDRTLILAMTAHAFREDEQRCLDAGMDAYISKPIDFKQCFELVNNLIMQKSSPTQ
jgi:CheY-like chemotaxis protein